MERTFPGDIDGRRYLLAFVLALAIMWLQEWLEPDALDGTYWQLLVLSLVMLPMLFGLLPEWPQFSRRTLGLLAVGLVAGVVSFWIHNRQFIPTLQVSHPSGVLGIVAGGVMMVVVIPLFEEKMVRQVMFTGLSKWLAPWLSAIVVSVAFGLAHRGAEVFSFGFSLVACWMTWRGIDTWDRAVFHGGANLAFFLVSLAIGYSP